MTVTINFNKLFVFSESNGCCFFDEFSSGANIISGRNTSGKSSLIQSLLFSFGVNDVKESLSEILDYKPTFRVDFTKIQNGIHEKYTIIREPKSVYVKGPNGKVVPFHGIDADQSVEHIKLKDYIRDLVGFNLNLEQKGEIKSAPLESMFLPYYISQSVGWVYLRESFSNLQYYRGFKDDYLDYYLGISNNFDRLEFRRLSQERDRLRADIGNLKRYSKQAEFQFSNLVDETCGDQAEIYIENYIQKSNLLEQERNGYIRLCNELSLLQNHHKILKKTKSNIHKQKYDDVDRCPACTQILSYSLEGLYSHYQKYNDTVELESYITEQLVDKKSKINSSNKKAFGIRKEIETDYSVILDKNIDGMTFDKWIANKANASLYRKMQSDLERLNEELEKNEVNLSKLNTEQETFSERAKKGRRFQQIFSIYTSQLALKPLSDSRYLDLYEINSFPRQGVELHKTVMAYHFALNALIEESRVAHRLPFLLDAVLKEDIDETNLDTILSFVGRNLPRDTQSFISISEHVKDDLKSGDQKVVKPVEKLKVEAVKNKYFSQETKLLYIGGGKIERGFLSQSLEIHKELYRDTLALTFS